MPSVLAAVAHPDDIEFVMAGTLILLADRGWSVHCINLANGCCGSMTMNRTETARTRLIEARNAVKLIDGTHYDPICDDMAIFYNPDLLAKVSAVVRRANPTIILTHSPQDYMEDHEATCRLVVSAAFTKAMPNVHTDPPINPVSGEVAIYHAQPHGNRSPLNQPVLPDFIVDISSVVDRKQAMLECHVSQQSWLDETQKMSSYVETMFEGSRLAAGFAEGVQYAEGFRRHLHVGFSHPGFDPLQEALRTCYRSVSTATR